MSHLRSHGRSTDPLSSRTESDSAGTVPVINALSAHRALTALAAAGYDREVEARRAGVPEVADPDFAWRVPLDAVEALFDRGVALCGPDFPLAARPLKAEENRSPVNLYCRTRRTVGEAFEAACELWDLVTDGYAMRLDHDAGGAWYVWCGPPRPNLYWFDIADSLATIRNVVPGPAIPTVRGATPPPPQLEALFGCGWEPGPEWAMRVPARLMATALPSVDPAVRALVERQLAAMRPVGPRSGPGIVAALWALGPTATATRLADLEGISERTLHRKLGLAGTSFRTEMDRIRGQFQRDAGDRSAEELAVLLGYSDVRAYRRAARRWR